MVPGRVAVGLSMAQRKAVTNRSPSCVELTGWARRHARRALLALSTPPAPRALRRRVYGEEVLEPLRFVWATL